MFESDCVDMRRMIKKKMNIPPKTDSIENISSSWQ